MIDIFDGFKENSLNLIFPIDEICMLCNKRKKLYKNYLCDSCYNSLNKNFYSCKYCGIALSSKSFGICDRCLNSDKYFNCFIKSYALSDESKKALYAYKNGRKRSLSYMFASIIEENLLESEYANKIDLIVPVPSSKKKIKVRGFDHIKDIVKKLSKSLDIPYKDVLERSTYIREQKSLSKKDRLKNIDNLFLLKKKINLPINVLLVDDLVTTGSTMIACAKSLKSTNANIYGITAFHTLYDK